jgi:hypothetical protein
VAGNVGKKKAIIAMLANGVQEPGSKDVYLQEFSGASAVWTTDRSAARRFNSKSEARRIGFSLCKGPFVAEVVTD